MRIERKSRGTTMRTLLINLVDREISFWRRPVLSLLASVLPVIGLDVLYAGPPGDLPLRVLLPALAISTLWGGFVMWRYVLFEIQEFRRLQSLAAEEERTKRTPEGS